MLNMLNKLHTTISITTILVCVMVVRPGLSLSLETGSGSSGYSGYTNSMCGATFTDRCPQLSKGGSICYEREWNVYCLEDRVWRRPLCPALPSPRRAQQPSWPGRPGASLHLQDH